MAKKSLARHSAHQSSATRITEMTTCDTSAGIIANVHGDATRSHDTMSSLSTLEVVVRHAPRLARGAL